MKKLILGGLLLSPNIVLAASNTGLPWENPLRTLQLSLTGPVGLAISLMSITIAGAALVFGGELSEFSRRLIMLVLVIALILGASGVLASLFGVTGAGI